MPCNCFAYYTLLDLKAGFDGEIYADSFYKAIYATDASAYREYPELVTFPRSVSDLKRLITFARDHDTFLIPRAAGTSLAGQVVGKGIIVDISKYFTQVLEINRQEQWVKVQPGVVLDELNKILQPMGLFFGPETSTSNRCMIGGMVGNNSCGSHSLVYGSTRDHLLEAKALLSDGSEVVFGKLSEAQFEDKCKLQSLEGNIYRNIKNILSNHFNQQEIRKEFPDKSIHRRNTGYAIDLLLETAPFTENAEAFNFCKLIAGSEGTLCVITEIKLNLVPLPPKEKAVVCVHCHSLDEAFHGNLIALKHKPVAVELMDDIILEQTKHNITQRRNRFFIEGEPKAILIIELAEHERTTVDQKAREIIAEFKASGLGYAYPVIYGNDITNVWALRKAGLGVLSNIAGDAKPVAVTEDTAVNPEVLPQYMNEFRQLLQAHNLSCVFHAHIATGELHLRPVLNLKQPDDVRLFHTIALETAKLVKKYKGSLSGEHGDGRLRGEFIPLMIGNHNYELLLEVKNAWDSKSIFNKGKITSTPSMNSSLRYEGVDNKEIENTYFDYSDTQGFLRAIEQCNGTADCRKSALIGGVMCPSYMATKNERNTTRARANVLREFLSGKHTKKRFDHKEIYDVLDLCLSCKGCKSECPSNVDMTRYKTEFLQHWYNIHAPSLRSWMTAHITKINCAGSYVVPLFNFFVKNKFTSHLIKKGLGFAQQRNISPLHKTTLVKWYKKHNILLKNPIKTIYLFADEFTNYNDVEIGITAIKLLNKLNYNVLIIKHKESGRTYLSKGFAAKAKKLANANVHIFKDLISAHTPLLGIEPSTILSFRDEYPALVNADLKQDMLRMAPHCLMLDEFLYNEFKKGNIQSGQFTEAKQHIRLHGHCHQKSISSTLYTKEVLSIPQHYSIDEIPSGCCGMAGSFGFEKEHYELSQQIGELVLFPEVRKTSEYDMIAAPGTSCRQQIEEGTGRHVFHPIEILFNALKP